MRLPISLIHQVASQLSHLRTTIGPTRLSQFKWKKWLLYLLGWSIAWALMSWVFWQFLHNAGLNRHEANLTISLWLGGSNIVVQVIAYYWITRKIIPAAITSSWLIVAGHLLLLHVSISLGRAYLQVGIGHYFAGYNPRLDQLTERIERTSFLQLPFSLMQFFDNWIYVYSVLLAPICLKVIKEIYIARNQALQLELNLLRAQINPHFVFNTLNNIYSIIEEKDAYAADVLLKFSHILRYTFYETEKDFIQLYREVDSLNAYVELEKIRHDQHVSIDLQIGAIDSSFPIPPLLLVSFVENAFKHGINSTIGASWVRINLRASQSRLEFDIVNSKPLLNSINVSMKGPAFTHQVGLTNIKRRLELLYPKTHQLVITDLPDRFSVRLLLTHDGKTNNLFTDR
ncbi:sensor histidine kinase [Spirosoma foliorum]|uniref:Histidine kinase n=1 Tax=Spirosoma foliorum TaxID=2710596 RepID=A0A7G5H2V9_9BACT|nr:histidine kinase [Spirosoma foliorum]QMW05451.1 histidine kinase [Spirosoma foliorum]